MTASNDLVWEAGMNEPTRNTLTQRLDRLEREGNGYAKG